MEKFKKDDPLLEDLDFNEEAQCFGCEDDARNYDFRLEDALLNKKRIEDPNYQFLEALAEFILFIAVNVDDGYRVDDSVKDET